MKRIRFSKKDLPFNVGDIVVFNDRGATVARAGTYYKVLQICEPITKYNEYKKMKVKRYPWTAGALPWTGSQDDEPIFVEQDVYGPWDKNGKKISHHVVEGYVKLAVEFRLIEKTKTTKTKTVSVRGSDLFYYDGSYTNVLKKVDIVDVGMKYVELGNFLKKIAKENDS